MMLSGGCALLEILGGYALSGYAARQQADLLPMLALRPFVLMLIALAASRWRWPNRLMCYASTLLAMTAGELLLIGTLGEPLPWALGMRAIAGSVALLVIYELVLLCGRGLRLPSGNLLAALVIVLLTLWPGTPLQSGFGVFVMPREADPPIAAKPVIVLSGLPLIWEEKSDIADLVRNAGEPPQSKLVGALRRFYRVVPVDQWPARQRGDFILLLAQPRPLGASGLAAFDRWLSSGGRALVIVDPALRWPSRFPLGDPRRPPLDAGLEPWLSHVGLRLGVGKPIDLEDRNIRWSGREYRLQLEFAGNLALFPRSPCTIAVKLFLADCRIGKGRAFVLADADLIGNFDSGFADGAANPAARRRDANVAWIIDLIAALDARPPLSPRVPWIDDASQLRPSLLLAALPGLLLLAAGALGFGIACRRK